MGRIDSLFYGNMDGWVKVIVELFQAAVFGPLEIFTRNTLDSMLALFLAVYIKHTDIILFTFNLHFKKFIHKLLVRHYVLLYTKLVESGCTTYHSLLNVCLFKIIIVCHYVVLYTKLVESGCATYRSHLNVCLFQIIMVCHYVLLYTKLVDGVCITYHSLLNVCLFQIVIVCHYVVLYTKLVIVLHIALY